jgi:ATP-binding cassette subfamily B protein
MSKFPFYRQLDQMDCGPTCLRMIAKYHGKTYSLDYLRKKSYITQSGVSLLGLGEASEAIGLRSLSVTVDFNMLKEQVPLPCIAYWRQRHFIVIHKIKGNEVSVADPAFGLMTYTKEKFLQGWLYNKKPEDEGVLLLLEPTPEFYEGDDPDRKNKKQNLSFLINYLRPHKRFLWQLVFGLVASILIQFCFPFLTQAIVDNGINNRNLQFIYIVLLGQLMLFFSQTAISILRSWILLHVGARINMAIISDFLLKLMKLPLSFFDSKMTADIMQRIDDNRRVENFLSSVTLNAVFSFFTLLIFGTVLAIYNFRIFLIFIVATILYIIWILLFTKKRAELDYKRYDEASENRSSILQLIHGITEIKLNNSERRRRWEWEAIQIRLFKISLKSLSYTQLQVTGANFINELKNIIIIIIAANDVVLGTLSLGTMLATQYILGQLNAPVSDFIVFIQSAQDAKLSIQRLSEVHVVKNEDSGRDDIERLPPTPGSLKLSGVSFQYGGPSSKWVLQDVNLEIPFGKVTAVVGVSGSGKTSLLKLLLKLYEPTKGTISVGDNKLHEIDTPAWRRECGVVMQDGFLFADTMSRNITESSSEEFIDKRKLQTAVQMANLENLVEGLPMGYNTNISWGGISLSGGERQRVLIARAIYKDPSFLFFDEATSSLDANNEREILERLSDYYVGKTVIIIAHRLSTVRNADQIVVFDKGKIAEIGDHDTLVAKKGQYFTLVKNQLELGK